jgi:hypothetical protein
MVRGVETEHKFGDNAAVTTKATVWDVGGIYAYIPSAQVLKVTSSSTDDVMTTGAGAWSVIVTGLDADWNEASEIVELNGQNTVLTTTTFIRMFRIETEQAASGAVGNVGDIYVGDGTVASGVPATKYAKMQAGNNQTLMAMLSVPAGKKLLITRWYANVGKGKEGVVDAVARDTTNSNVFKLKQRRRLFESTDASYEDIPFAFPEKWDLEIRGTCATATAVAAGFSYVLLDNSTVSTDNDQG